MSEVSDLGIRVGATASGPMYQQVFDQIAERIQRGTFPPGFRLPPTRALGASLGVHRNTVVRAYQRLEDAGFLISEVGRGTFVADVDFRISGPGSALGLGSASRQEKRLLTPMPWSSLVSPHLMREPMRRRQRFAQSLPPGKYINLSGMQPAPELLPHELFGRCLEQVLRTRQGRALGYAPFDGMPALREQIALDLSRQGIPASADDVLVTTGSQQALDIVARVLLTPGDIVLVDPWTYGGAIETFTSMGARLVAVPRDSDGPLMPELRRLPTERVKFFYLMPNHLNPTGAFISEARRTELIAWSRQAGIPLVEDDYVSELRFEGAKSAPALRALDGEVIYVSTYSKKLIPSLRIGMMVAPPELRAHLVVAKHAMDLSNGKLNQLALAEFLERGYLPAHLGRTAVAYQARRDALFSALHRHLPASYELDESGRGLTVWLRCPEGISSRAVFDAARDAGVVVSPGALCRVAHGLDAERDGVRLAFCGESPKRLETAARKLGRALETLRVKSKARSSGELEPLGLV